MPIIITNEEVRNAIGKDLETIAGKLPADKDFVLVPKEDHIPKSRFDEVNNASKEHKAKADKYEADLAAAVKGAKSVEELQAAYKSLSEASAKERAEHEAQIVKIRQDHALEDALKAFKPRNVKAVSALLDGTKIEFKDGVLKGAAEQLEALRKSDPYLFDDGKPDSFIVGRENKGQQQQVGKSTFAVDDPLAAAFQLIPKK